MNASGNHQICDYNDVFADDGVVNNMNQVVDFRSIAYDCIIEGTLFVNILRLKEKLFLITTNEDSVDLILSFKFSVFFNHVMD